MNDPYVLAVDQGTGSTRAVAVNRDGQVSLGAQVPISLSSPRPGWVEQDADEILGSVRQAIGATIDKLGPAVEAIGLSTQRESAVAWDAATGAPLGPMLGWQDRRTSQRAGQLQAEIGDQIRAASGLPIDPMFSALKFEWLLDQIDPNRTAASAGRIRLGTVDAWLIARLTGEFRIETGNASRTQLLNVHTAQWDPDLLDIFRIPRAALPEVVRSDAASAPIEGLATGTVRITGVLGDSHAALFAHGAREPGSVKATYGTGSSVMGLAAQPVPAESGLVETIGWETREVARAFEGNILSTGGTLVWLGKVLNATPQELDQLARTVESSGGVYLVPAFAGLGAPWWDERASGLITGFSLGTTREHVARAALESIPFQIEDVLQRADTVAGTRIEVVLVDGGPSRNDWLMQRQADLSQRIVRRPREAGLSALGAAQMAGLGSGFWSWGELESLPQKRAEFVPNPISANRTEDLAGWAAAVARSRARTNENQELTTRDVERKNP